MIDELKDIDIESREYKAGLEVGKTLSRIELLNSIYENAFNLQKQHKAFANMAPNKIQLHFPDGQGISIIWGSGSYTENQNYWIKEGIGLIDAEMTFMSSNDCEVYLIGKVNPVVKAKLLSYSEQSEFPLSRVSLAALIFILEVMRKECSKTLKSRRAKKVK